MMAYPEYAFPELKTQVERTSKNLESGEININDRIFLNNILDEFVNIVELIEQNRPGMVHLADALLEMVGTVNEQVVDEA
jgi:hypothetical protein